MCVCVCVCVCACVCVCIYIAYDQTAAFIKMTIPNYLRRLHKSRKTPSHNCCNAKLAIYYSISGHRRKYEYRFGESIK